jgi:hypothetical protein
MILTLEEMYGDTRGCCINYNSDLARSRDNRYIAFITGYKDVPGTPDSRGVWLVDLKTRKFVNVHTSAIRVHFTYDSKKLLYIDGGMYEYDIASGKEIKRYKPLQGTSGYALSGPENIMIMHRGTKIYFFTFEGKPIRTIDLKTLLPDWTDDDFRYSSDGSLYSANSRYVVIPFFNHGNTLLDLSEQQLIAIMKNSDALPNGDGILFSNSTYYATIPGGISEIFPKYKGTVVPFPGEFIPKELAGGHHVLSMGNRILINEKY